MLFKNKKTFKDFYEELKLILHDKKGVNLSLEHIEIFKEIFKRSLYFKDKAFIHELYDNRESGLEIAIDDIHSLKLLMQTDITFIEKVDWGKQKISKKKGEPELIEEIKDVIKKNSRYILTDKAKIFHLLFVIF